MVKELKLKLLTLVLMFVHKSDTKTFMTNINSSFKRKMLSEEHLLKNLLISSHKVNRNSINFRITD